MLNGISREEAHTAGHLRRMKGTHANNKIMLCEVVNIEMFNFVFCYLFSWFILFYFSFGCLLKFHDKIFRFIYRVLV